MLNDLVSDGNRLGLPVESVANGYEMILVPHDEEVDRFFVDSDSLGRSVIEPSFNLSAAYHPTGEIVELEGRVCYLVSAVDSCDVLRLISKKIRLDNLMGYSDSSLMGSVPLGLGSCHAVDLRWFDLKDPF